MLFPVKIEFMEWPSGSWADWSALLHDAPVISKKVESENEGEAGLIVFDDCNATFRFKNEVRTESSYEIYLDAVDGAVKYHFFLEKKSSSPYHLIDGMDYYEPDVTAWEIGESVNPTISILLTDDGSEYTSGVVAEDSAGLYSAMRTDMFNVDFNSLINSLVDDAFGDETRLTAAQRYMYRISNIRKGLYDENFEFVTHLGDQLVTEDGDVLGSNYKGAHESKLFEGMADFSTLEWPENGRIVSFSVLDKLSALDILQSVPVRTLFGIKDATSNHLPWIVPLNYANGDYYEINVGNNPSAIIEVTKYVHPSFTPEHIDVGTTTPVVSAGMILKREETGNDKYFFAKAQWFDEGNYPGENDTWLEPSSDSDSILGAYRIDSSDADCYLQTDPTIKLKYYKDLFYASELCNTSFSSTLNTTTVTSFKGEKALTQLVAQAWGQIYPVFKGLTTFNIPYEYWRQTMDENPFGKTPLEALKMLANTMKVYVYFNKEGILVIHARSESSLASSGTTRTIGTTKVIKSFTRKYFWDKIVDGVTIEVKSWLTDGGGDALVGAATVTKQIQTGAYIKPKNTITKEILTNSSLDVTQEDLDAKALEEATAYLDFYGKRRSSYEGILALDENTEAWELVDNIELNGVDYFFTSDEIDPADKTVSLEAVEVVGHDYDRRQVVITPSGN